MESSAPTDEGFNLSPKVYVPLVLAVVAILVQWFVTGSFDKAELGQAILVAVYAVVGIGVKPVQGSDITQKELVQLVRQHQGHRLR